MPIKVSCSCGQSFNAKDELAGKRVRCPKCKNPLQIPAAAAPPAADLDDFQLAPAAEVPKYNPLEDILQDEGVKAAATGPVCPSCSEPINPSAVLCVQCGFNLQTGEKITANFDDDDDDDEEAHLAGMSETEKMLYKADRELDDMPISAVGEKFGDEAGDSTLVGIGVFLAVCLAVGLSVLGIWQLDQFEEFDTVRVSFYASFLFVIGSWVTITVVAFKESAQEGNLCLTFGYALWYAITRGLFVPLAVMGLFGLIAAGCYAAMGD